MKTRSDLTISSVLIGYGVFFFILIFIADNTVAAQLFPLCASILWFLLALRMIETYEITGDILFKKTFLGLINKRIDLNHLVNFSIKNIDTDISVNPINIVKLFSKNSKYLVYRKVTLNFGDYGKMKIDERTIESQDFNKLINKIKPYTNKDRSSATIKK